MVVVLGAWNTCGAGLFTFEVIPFVVSKLAFPLVFGWFGVRTSPSTEVEDGDER